MVEPQLCSRKLPYELVIQRNRLAVGQVLGCLREAGHDGRHADPAGSEPGPDGYIAVLAWNEDGYVNLVPAKVETFTRAGAEETPRSMPSERKNPLIATANFLVSALDGAACAAAVWGSVA
ncbi:MAG: hypothetical protein JWN47_2060, partial [Frankiales bacterium]|nr:hypothetical protein [Frankiales bacterium]